MSCYKWNELLSEKRERQSGTKEDHRTEFDKDYDRIISSSSLRRLQDKAQVFPLQENDFTRTRLTHSLEVSSIGRSLGLAIGKKLIYENKDGFTQEMIYKMSSLLAVAGLVHDLGNPPFGHYGETIVRHWFVDWFEKNKDVNIEESGKLDFTRFEGNAQSLRIVSKLQFLNDEYGLNFTYGTLGAIIKYPWNSSDKKAEQKDKFGYFLSEKKLVETIFENTGTGMNGKKNPLSYLLEAADDIAYLLADIEDGVKKGVVSWKVEYEKLKNDFGTDENLKDAFEYVDKKNEKHESNEMPEVEIINIQNFRVQIQGALIKEAVTVFINNYIEIMDGKFEGDLLKNGKYKNIIEALRNITKKTCFCCTEVLTLELVGENVLSGLLDRFANAVIGFKEDEGVKRKNGKLCKLISDNFKYICQLKHNDSSIEKLPQYEKLMLVTDYITGMTDSYAVNLHKKLIGVKL